MMIIELIQFVAILLLMLITGIFWGPWFSIHRSMKEFNKEEFIHIVKVMSSNLAVPMRIMLPSCIAFMTLSLINYPTANTVGFYSLSFALLLILVSLIVTITIEVPIVKKIEQWTIESIPENIEAIQNRWLKFHRIRTFSALLSFSCLIASFLFLS